MESLICPQCGAQLDESHVTGETVRCQYCATQFHVARSQPVFQQPQPFVVVETTRAPKAAIGLIALMPLVIILVVFVFIGGIFYFVFTSINHTVGTAVNSAQQQANQAKSTANAIKTAANTAAQQANTAAQRANAAQQRANYMVNTLPSPHK